MMPVRDSWSRKRLVEQVQVVKDAAYRYKRIVEGKVPTPFQRYTRNLEAKLEASEQKVKELKAEVARLETALARAKKTSSNSSKPPSSDITKSNKNKSSGKRKKGGQKGHPKWKRKPFDESEIDKKQTYTLKNCPCCKDAVTASDREDECLQQIEKVEKPYFVTEHRSKVYWCPACQKHVSKPIPDEIVKLGLFGPRLTAEVALMKSEGHMSYSAIQTFLKDAYGITVCRGFLAKVIKRASQSIAEPVKDLEGRLWTEPILNIDETGHKENGDKYWTWCFRTPSYAVFSVVSTRSSKELLRVLTEDFGGLIGCDYFSAYTKFARLAEIELQLCWAHLIRDIKFLITPLPFFANLRLLERFSEQSEVLSF